MGFCQPPVSVAVLGWTVSNWRYLAWAALLLSHWSLAASITVYDDTGREVTLHEPAKRIISLAPHTTELLFAVGAGAQVVGVVSYSDYPPAAAQLPVVGSSASLNLESIISLHPDLIVAWKSGNAANQVEHLIDLHIPVFYSEPRHLEDIASNLRRLGTLAGTNTIAEAAAQAFRDTYEQIGHKFSQLTPVRTFYQIWYQPLITVNGDHLISQVISLCGGKNIFADLSTLAPAVNPEAVLAADPQAIIASGKARERPDWLKAWQAWPHISAVKNRQLYVIDPDLIQRQTPRILEGARILCEQLQRARKVLREEEKTPH
jgi:iron complex transport system substrate-binding protein